MLTECLAAGDVLQVFGFFHHLCAAPVLGPHERTVLGMVGERRVIIVHVCDSLYTFIYMHDNLYTRVVVGGD